jgi:hypothetical protein
MRGASYRDASASSQNTLKTAILGLKSGYQKKTEMGKILFKNPEIREKPVLLHAWY